MYFGYLFLNYFKWSNKFFLKKVSVTYIIFLIFGSFHINICVFIIFKICHCFNLFQIDLITIKICI